MKKQISYYINIIFNDPRAIVCLFLSVLYIGVMFLIFFWNPLEPLCDFCQKNGYDSCISIGEPKCISYLPDSDIILERLVMIINRKYYLIENELSYKTEKYGELDGVNEFINILVSENNNLPAHYNLSCILQECLVITGE